MLKNHNSFAIYFPLKPKKKAKKSTGIIDRIKKIDFKNKLYYILDEFKQYIFYNRQL